MAITINTKELLNILELTPTHQNVMLVGKHGIGKSEILKSYFETKNIPVVVLFLGQMSDPGDLIGLPNKNETTGKTEFLPPYWFPNDEKPIVLFLDELNRARPEVLQTIMDLTLTRTLAGKKLPEGSMVISAINDGEEYQLTDLDPALISRFNIFIFKPTVQEWMLWATKNKLDERVTSFLQENSKWLDGDDSPNIDKGLEKSPDRRAWQKVSDCIKGNKNLQGIHKKLIAGIVGKQAASNFISSISDNKVLSAKEVLLSLNKHISTLENYELHQISIVNDSIFRYLETNEYNDSDKPVIIRNLGLYVDNFTINNRKEAMAHFVSLFEKGNYNQALLFILTETPNLYENIKTFIKNL